MNIYKIEFSIKATEVLYIDAENKEIAKNQAYELLENFQIKNLEDIKIETYADELRDFKELEDKIARNNPN